MITVCFNKKSTINLINKANKLNANFSNFQDYLINRYGLFTHLITIFIASALGFKFSHSLQGFIALQLGLVCLNIELKNIDIINPLCRQIKTNLKLKVAQFLYEWTKIAQYFRQTEKWVKSFSNNKNVV